MIALADELALRYWRLIRHAEYEFLPFSAKTGENLLITSGVLPKGDSVNFSMSNYVEMKENLLRIRDTFGTSPSKNAWTVGPSVYRRIIADAPDKPLLPKATDEDLRLLEVSSYPTQQEGKPRVLSVRLGTQELVDAGVSKWPARLRNIRVNFVTSKGILSKPLTYVVRDTRDSFPVARDAATDQRWVVDFEHASGKGDFVPLHHTGLFACGVVPPTTCLLKDQSCHTAFQDSMSTDCSPLYLSDHKFELYNRGLIGRWTLAVPEDEVAKLGEVQAVEVLFDTWIRSW
jgi:hypothetical protein